MTHMTTVLANSPPKRVKSPGPTVVMNRTAQLRIQKLRNDVNDVEQRRSPFKAQTRQINNTIRSRIEIFEKNKDEVVVKPQPIIADKMLLKSASQKEKETDVIVVNKPQEKSAKRALLIETKKYETVDVPIRPPVLAISVSPWTSSGHVVTDPDSKQAELLLAERRKLLENRPTEVKTEITLRPTSTDSIDEVLRESSGASLDVSFPRALDFAKHSQRPLWREVRGIQERGLIESLSKEARVRQEAKFELMMSEATFLHSLNILNFHYMKNIQKHIPQVISDKDYDILFKHAGDIRACSEVFLEALDKIWQSDPMLNDIYSVVTVHTNEHFGPYIKYCRNMLEMRNHLQQLTTTNEAFKNLLDFLINREGAQKLSLDSFLTSPMQRITKLPLLLKTILKQLEEGSEEYLQCTIAYDAASKIASECDSVVAERKNMEELLKLSNELEFGEDTLKSVPIVVPGRSIVYRTRVKHFVFRDKAPKREKLELILLTDLLIVTKRKSDKLLVVDYCHRDKVQLKEMDNPTLYGQGENDKQLKPVAITMLNNSQDKKLDLVVTFKVKEQCKEWLEIFAAEPTKNLSNADETIEPVLPIQPIGQETQDCSEEHFPEEKTLVNGEKESPEIADKVEEKKPEESPSVTDSQVLPVVVKILVEEPVNGLTEENEE